MKQTTTVTRVHAPLLQREALARGIPHTFVEDGDGVSFEFATFFEKCTFDALAEALGILPVSLSFDQILDAVTGGSLSLRAALGEMIVVSPKR
jgi:hypothetical protein